jgi:hypothetical protein
MPLFDQVSIPSDESLMTPAERRLRQLNSDREQRSAEGKQETIAQQKEYEEVLRQNLISDLEDLRRIVDAERQATTQAGHVHSLEVLIASGYLPRDAAQDESIKIGEYAKDMALKRLNALREVDERLSMLDGALCLPNDECARLADEREQALQRLLGEWGVN